MPRAVHVIITGLAWLSLPLWALAAVAAVTWDTRSVVIAFGAALTATCAWPYQHLTGHLEEYLRQHADMVHARETALIRAIDHLASGPEPAADGDEGEGGPRGLHVAS